MIKSLKSLLLIFSFLLITVSFAQDNVFTSYDLLRTKYVVETSISPDGNYIAYTLHVPRQLDDSPGKHYRYLYLFNRKSAESKELLGDNVFISSIGWLPDSKSITFRAKINEDKFTQVYQLPIDAEEPVALTNSLTSVLQYQVSIDGNQLAFVATSIESDKKKKLVEKGFDVEIYEEEYLDRNLYLLHLKSQRMAPKQITSGVSVFDFQWSPDGKQIAAFIADKNLVDYSYMFKKVYLIDPTTGERTLHLDNPGKITQLQWSPDGKHTAIIASSSLNDAVSGSLFITEVPNIKNFAELKNYAADKELSIRNVKWKDKNTVLFQSEEGVDITLSEQGINDEDRTLLIKPGRVVFHNFSLVDDIISFAGNTAKHPAELYTFSLNDGKLSKLSDLNPWLENVNLGKQVELNYNARDGLEIQGSLIYPIDYNEGEKYPLICMIHGGPESTMQNGWQTSYSRWGQIASGKGYFVFMPNYRASASRGIEFTMKGFGDTGGAEFTDVLDGIDYLVNKGLVDKKHVGIGGGSYGGFFAAYGATRYSDYFAASVMFVGISDHYSKRFTTDIPFESYDVHWGFWPDENIQFLRERSPITYASNSKTPTLILGGKDDPRVHPSQSLEMYRALKLFSKAPVRLVRYPKEGHGNRINTNRLDYSLRTMRWFDYYLKGDNLKKEMPPKYLDME